MSEERDPMLVTMVCLNKDCKWCDQHRTIRRPYVAQGLYQHAQLVCECGNWAAEVKETDKGTEIQHPRWF